MKTHSGDGIRLGLFVTLIAIFTVALTTGVTAARRQKITVTIHSTPEGAQVFSGDVPRLVGVTPLALQYELSGACESTQAVRVRWASGAEASLAALQLCRATGKRQQITFERPLGVDGLELDLQVAYQQAMLAQLQAIARAAEAPPPPALTPWSPLPKTSAICVTRQVANGVTYVNCR